MNLYRQQNNMKRNGQLVMLFKMHALFEMQASVQNAGISFRLQTPLPWSLVHVALVRMCHGSIEVSWGPWHP